MTEMRNVVGGEGPRRVTLVGYRASGKSTVGKRLSRALGLPFVDLDAEIERHTALSVAALFAKGGEPYFRQQEAACLAAVLQREGPMLLATGGGAVIGEANRQMLRQYGGVVIYLQAQAAVLARRLARSKGGVRPSLSGRPIDQEVEEILAQREGWYREVADWVVNVERGSQVVVSELRQRLQVPKPP